MAALPVVRVAPTELRGTRLAELERVTGGDVSVTTVRAGSVAALEAAVTGTPVVVVLDCAPGFTASDVLDRWPTTIVARPIRNSFRTSRGELREDFVAYGRFHAGTVVDLVDGELGTLAAPAPV